MKLWPKTSLSWVFCVFGKKRFSLCVKVSLLCCSAFLYRNIYLTCLVCRYTLYRSLCSRRMASVLFPSLAVLLLFVSSSTFFCFLETFQQGLELMHTHSCLFHGCHTYFPHPLEDVKSSPGLLCDLLFFRWAQCLWAFAISFSWCGCPCDGWCLLIVLFALSLRLGRLWPLFAQLCRMELGAVVEAWLQVAGGRPGMGRAFLWLVCPCGLRCFSVLLNITPAPPLCLETAAGPSLTAAWQRTVCSGSAEIRRAGFIGGGQSPLSSASQFPFLRKAGVEFWRSLSCF